MSLCTDSDAQAGLCWLFESWLETKDDQAFAAKALQLPV